MGLTNPQDQIIDGVLDLSVTRKKRFRVNEDNNAILELNTSDMNAIVRLQEEYPKLMKLANKVTTLQDKMNEEKTDDETTEQEITRIASTIKSIDEDMRQCVDHIFDSNVSEVCVGSGSMYDLFNGKFRFEHIIEKLSELYETNMASEFKAVNKRISKHTAKYTR